MTLDQLGDLIAWDKSDDYLYRLLDALKRSEWIEYPTTPGKKQHVYAIRLLWDRPERSEDGPRIESAPSPSTAAAEDGSRADVPPAAPSNESEDDDGRTTAAGPSTEPSGPRIEDSSNPDAEQDSRSIGAEPVRARRDVRERTNPSSKEKFKDQRLGSSDHRTGDGTAETNDDALLAALGFETNGDGPAVALSENDREWIDGLVDEFDAVLVEAAPLCRYPSHRSSDWTNEGGRVVCGVCHPRAKGSAT